MGYGDILPVSAHEYIFVIDDVARRIGIRVYRVNVSDDFERNGCQGHILP